MMKLCNGITLITFIWWASFACAMQKRLPENDSDNASMLRIMTYNIRRAGKEKTKERQWNNRLPLLKEQLLRLKPNIIGFQEATITQINDLEKELPHFARIGKGRGASWWGLGTNEHTPIFYEKDRFELLANETFSINQITEKLGWTPLQVTQTGWLPRICTWGKFKDKKTGKSFYVYNTHLDNTYHAARLNGLRAINDDIDEHTHGLPVILMGDFNTEITPDIKELLAHFYVAKDRARFKSGPEQTRTGWQDEELKSIDHILIKDDNATVFRYAVISSQMPYPSDHRAVLADISLNGNN